MSALIILPVARVAPKTGGSSQATTSYACGLRHESHGGTSMDIHPNLVLAIAGKAVAPCSALYGIQ